MIGCLHFRIFMEIAGLVLRGCQIIADVDGPGDTGGSDDYLGAFES